MYEGFNVLFKLLWSRNLKVLQNYYKLEVLNKQKLLDSTIIAEDINRISLLLRKHLLTPQIQELQVHAAIHQTQAESQAQQVCVSNLNVHII